MNIVIEKIADLSLTFDTEMPVGGKYVLCGFVNRPWGDDNTRNNLHFVFALLDESYTPVTYYTVPKFELFKHRVDMHNTTFYSQGDYLDYISNATRGKSLRAIPFDVFSKLVEITQLKHNCYSMTKQSYYIANSYLMEDTKLGITDEQLNFISENAKSFYSNSSDAEGFISALDFMSYVKSKS